MSIENKANQSQPQVEVLDPKHFYAAYVFDSPHDRAQDIYEVITQAGELDYPVRYWWLSEAVDIGEYEDRLIICAHHSSISSDAGLDLHRKLKEKQVQWDDMEAAAFQEYVSLGKEIQLVANILLPDGSYLFPSLNTPICYFRELENVHVAQFIMADQRMPEHSPRSQDYVALCMDRFSQLLLFLLEKNQEDTPKLETNLAFLAFLLQETQSVLDDRISDESEIPF